MEKRKWLWKRKSSEKSSCETESSGSISSLSERYSDEQQEALKGSPDHNTQSPEVSSKAVARTEGIDESPLKTEDVNDSLKILTEKLSAALVNVSAKEDLVKQHAKVAEEAVAGWEKAENEVAILKQQLEASVQQKSALENRVSHLDGALKECVRQLRQARDEQELKVHEAMSAKTLEWDSIKCVLESRLLELQNKVEFSTRMDPDICLKLEFLEKENSALRLEIHAQMEELEVRTIERDLSTQAAETASKQHLESIKKVAKLEAECRRLKAMACKSPLGNDHKSTAASLIYVKSFMDSHSDSGDRLNAVDVNMQKVNSLEPNKRELNLSDSWASALIAELDQFKNEKNVNKSLPNSSVEINLMDDFLEMERLAALQPTESRSSCLESNVVEESQSRENVLRAELEAMIHRTAELEQRLERLETEKAQLEARASKNEESVLRAELEVRIHRITELEERLENWEIEKAEMENKSRSEESSLRNELQATIHLSAELEEKLGKLEMEKAESENESKIVESLLRSKLEAMIHQTAELEEKLDMLETEKADLENKSKSAESVLRAELEAMIHRTAELEEKLENLETEKGESENESKSAESVLRTELEAVIQRTAELEEKIEKLEAEKAESENESKSMESVLKTELEAMIHRTAALEEKLEKFEIERADLEEKLEKLETENAELEDTLEKLEVEKAELEASESKHGESVLRTELAMIHKTAELEEKLETLEVEKAELKAALRKSQECMEASQLQMMEAELKLEVLQRELKIAKESKQTIEYQLVNLEAEARTVSKKASILEEEVQRERALSGEIALRCRELKDELSMEKEEVKLRQTASSKPPEKKIKQEDLAVAAGKLAECQKTIASLGNQLKSLATLEDFLIDAANLPEFNVAASLNPRTGEQWKLHSNHTFSPKRDIASPKMGDERSFVPSLRQNHDENPSPPSSLSSSSSTSAMVLSSNVSSEKNRNGFAKFFSRTKSGIRLEI